MEVRDLLLVSIWLQGGMLFALMRVVDLLRDYGGPSLFGGFAQFVGAIIFFTMPFIIFFAYLDSGYDE
jgi:hypothetical protein